jgi:insertion element IS1 protein InsB
MWSYVGAKRFQRWLWWVEDVATGQVVAYVFGRRTHETFRKLLCVLKQAGLPVKKWMTDAWGAYEACLPAEQHLISKPNLQRLERKHLTLRTRIKRLTRKTICFSKSTFFHDGIIELFIHHFFFVPKIASG